MGVTNHLLTGMILQVGGSIHFITQIPSFWTLHLQPSSRLYESVGTSTPPRPRVQGHQLSHKKNSALYFLFGGFNPIDPWKRRNIYKGCYFWVLPGYVNISGWWLNQPIWRNMLVKMGSSSPNFRGEHKKYLSCHHLAYCLIRFLRMVIIRTELGSIISQMYPKQPCFFFHFSVSFMFFYLAFPPKKTILWLNSSTSWEDIRGSTPRPWWYQPHPKTYIEMSEF